MPTYDYECEKGHRFERIQSIKDEPIKICLINLYARTNTNAIRTCNAPCKRLITASNFILKGSGWAKDGYGPGEKKKPKPKE